MSAQMLFQSTVVSSSSYHFSCSSFFEVKCACCLHEIDSIDAIFSPGKDRKLASPPWVSVNPISLGLSIKPVHFGSLQR